MAEHPLVPIGMAMPGTSSTAPQHPLFGDVQAQAAAAAALQPPVLMNRTAGEGATDVTDEIDRMVEEGVEETVSNEVFSLYKYKEVIPGCLPHPGDIVEAGSLAHLALPPAVYPLQDSVPKEVIGSGKLSSLQLEGIMYACQRHQLILPSGQRAGFFIGDAAGVGKGRQISGIILDNFARGRTKHIWFSISSDLIVDARRDLGDIGCHIKVIEGCQQLDRETRVLGLPSDFKEGIIFSTYATLVSSVQSGGAFNANKKSRLQQLVDWCGGESFEGCLIFDECHKAKNFVPGKETASTKVAMSVSAIQKLLPKARVVYCSATGVSDVKNMAYMERLGLWGDGAAFKSFEIFLDTVQRKGLGVAEMLAMEMKTSGMYVSRGLSFKQAEFVTVEVTISKEQSKMYNTAAHVWNEIKKALESALERTNCNNNRVWSAFWAAHQRFFKQLCMGIKVPAIVEESKKALEDGYCVVIGLQTTGEASLESELSRNGSQLTKFVSLCREIITRFVQGHFPTMIEGKTSDKGPVEDDWSVTAKQMLLGFAQQIKLPDSPLDDIIDKLGGPDNVAEMTGRRGRVVRRHPNDTPQYELRDSGDSNGGVESLNVRERNQFMTGEKLVAIISDAASTGISLHADSRVANQRRRVHMTIELPWSADKAVQQLGRSHRSNQSSGPLYKLMTTNLGGEKRFASAVARRLQSLGALTKGDRRAATGADLAEFNFDTPYGRTALRNMYAAICQKSMAQGVSIEAVTRGRLEYDEFVAAMQECLLYMGLMETDTISSAAKVKDRDAGDVGKFLNRILGLSVERQNTLFTYFSLCLDAQVLMAKKEGRFNEGLVDITAPSVEMIGQPREVFKGKATSNNPTKHIILNIDRGMPFEKAVVRLQNYPGSENGFYCSRRTRGRKFYVLATLKPGSSHLYKIARPNTGVSNFEEEKVDLLQKYKKISQDDAEKGWSEQYETSQNQCIHGPNCRSRAGFHCAVGSRCYRVHLLCGGIVTMMSLLELTIAKYGPKLQLSKVESVLRVVRAQLDNGERVVGIRYPEVLIPLVEKAIEEEKNVKHIVEKQMLLNRALLLGNAASVQLIQSQLANLTSNVPADQQSVKSLTEEDISPVIAKCLTKATTPPVTIKSFFKPSTKAKTKTEEPSSCEESQSGKGKNGGSPDQKDEKDKQQLDKTKSLVEPRGLKRPSSSSSSSFSQTASGKPSKKAKQANIMASFAKQKSKKEEQKTRQLTCPICSKDFDPKTSNADFNDHIDNCLID